VNPILTLLTVVGGLFEPVRGIVRYARIHWSSRQRDIAPVWSGEAKERFLTANEEEEWLNSRLTLRLRQHGYVLTGEIEAFSSNKQHYHLNVEGRLEDTHCLTLTVRSSSPGEINFGVLLLQLNAKGNELHGHGLLSGLGDPRISLATIDLSRE
jgi:hypothetical protein